MNEVADKMIDIYARLGEFQVRCVLDCSSGSAQHPGGLSYEGGGIIFLCPFFFQTTDSERRDIYLHELSHLTGTTGDHCADDAACRQLATQDPVRAIDSAGSFERYARNFPILD